jgi:COP9 signalosome complex subunit 7
MSGAVAAQFRDMASKSSGAALASVLQQILQHPEIFVFGEFLALASVQAIKESKEYALLELFAYDRFEHYVARKATLPTLNAAQEKKLKQLTLVSLAVDATSLSYAQMQAATGTSDVRELENLIISCIYAGVLSGKMDQGQQAFVVRGCAGRDVRASEIASMLAFIRAWRHQADSVLHTLAQQQDAISGRVQARRAEAAARAKAVADKKDAVQAQMLVDAKEGAGASAATTDDDMLAFVSGMGHAFDKRRARPGRREP